MAFVILVDSQRHLTDEQGSTLCGIGHDWREDRATSEIAVIECQGCRAALGDSRSARAIMTGWDQVTHVAVVSLQVKVSRKRVINAWPKRTPACEAANAPGVRVIGVRSIDCLACLAERGWYA